MLPLLSLPVCLASATISVPLPLLPTDVVDPCCVWNVWMVGGSWALRWSGTILPQLQSGQIFYPQAWLFAFTILTVGHPRPLHFPLPLTAHSPIKRKEERGARLFRNRSTFTTTRLKLTTTLGGPYNMVATLPLFSIRSPCPCTQFKNLGWFPDFTFPVPVFISMCLTQHAPWTTKPSCLWVHADVFQLSKPPGNISGWVAQFWAIQGYNISGPCSMVWH